MNIHYDNCLDKTDQFDIKELKLLDEIMNSVRLITSLPNYIKSEVDTVEYRITVKCSTEQSFHEFQNLISQSLDMNTESIYFPKRRESNRKFKEIENDKKLVKRKSNNNLHPNDCSLHWIDLPSFNNEKKNDCYKKFEVKFRNEKDYKYFQLLLNQNMTNKTKIIHFPKVMKTTRKIWIDESHD